MSGADISVIFFPVNDVENGRRVHFVRLRNKFDSTTKIREEFLPQHNHLCIDGTTRIDPKCGFDGEKCGYRLNWKTSGMTVVFSVIVSVGVIFSVK